MTAPVLLPGQEPSPGYTQEALEHRIEGIMVVRCVLDVEGRVRACKVIKGLPYLNAAALSFLDSRRYTPVSSEGKPIPVRYTFNFRFRIRDALRAIQLDDLVMNFPRAVKEVERNEVTWFELGGDGGPEGALGILPATEDSLRSLDPRVFSELLQPFSPGLAPGPVTLAPETLRLGERSYSGRSFEVALPQGGTVLGRLFVLGPRLLVFLKRAPTDEDRPHATEALRRLVEGLQLNPMQQDRFLP